MTSDANEIVELEIDLERSDYKDYSGIYCRAKRGDRWESVDIAELTEKSLKDFLKNRGGNNERAEQVVAILLDHKRGLNL